MKTFFYRSLALLVPIIGASSLQAGILFYVPIPASESDPNSGISGENTYTTAVDGGNALGTDRVVNGITLYALTGDGQPSVETGWFNEYDATTASGGFKDPNQVYYVDYRYTWDGDTSPGITISQRYGRSPFCLYALPNQVVSGEELGTAATGAETAA